MSSHSESELSQQSAPPEQLVPRIVVRLKERSPRVIVPTEHGVFAMQAWIFADGSEHISAQAVNAAGNPLIAQAPYTPVRIHSECATGDLFGSFRCDCGPQLAQAMAILQQRGGYLIYARNHEGRGIGLVNKLRAYDLQDQGLDTVDANLHLGLAADARDYRQAAIILGELGLNDIQLITNNPAKQHALQELGITVHGLIADRTEPRAENLTYLQTKEHRMNHLLNTKEHQ